MTTDDWIALSGIAGYLCVGVLALCLSTYFGILDNGEHDEGGAGFIIFVWPLLILCALFGLWLLVSDTFVASARTARARRDESKRKANR